MRHVLTVAFVALWLSATAAHSGYKYQEGDCITPTNESWSWYRDVGIVQGVFKRLDQGDYTGYILYFPKLDPKHRSLVGVFAIESLEKETEKVPAWMCERDQSG